MASAPAMEEERRRSSPFSSSNGDGAAADEARARGSRNPTFPSVFRHAGPAPTAISVAAASGPYPEVGPPGGTAEIVRVVGPDGKLSGIVGSALGGGNAAPDGRYKVGGSLAACTAAQHRHIRFAPLRSSRAKGEGDEVALLCAKIFHTELHNHPNFQDNLMSAVRSVFFRMDELLLQSDEWKELTKPPPDVWVQFLKAGVCAHYWPFILALTNPYVAPQCTGSTACIVVIRGSQIILGHVGDSRCVLSSNGQAIQLTKDHKPTEKNEAKRILGAGGKIDRVKIPITRGRFHGYKLGASRINGVLTVSRAIGDFAFKQDKNLTPQEQMVTCDPELIDMDINNDMEFLVIASDGIWDCMTTEGVVEFVHKNLRTGVTDLRIICERLIERTLPSSDNATVILVMFKHTDGISTCQRQPLLYINNDPTEEY